MIPHCPHLGRPLLIKHGGEDGQLGEGLLLGLGQGLKGEGDAGCIRAILRVAVECWDTSSGVTTKSAGP